VTGRVDIVVIGAGMAGASLAAELADHASVMILEAEDQPGYHATGRSAAFWSETYGGPWVQPLTTASRAFLQVPDPGFYDRSFLTPRGALHLADESGAAALDRLMADFADSTVELRPLGRPELLQIIPALRPGWDRAICEPSCADIDVAALHAAYLRQAHRAGGVLRTGARVTAIAHSGHGWRLDIGNESVEADVIVNAAGAWADAIAGLAGVRQLGIRPYRRTMIQLAVDPPAPSDLPLVIDARERFYFKPETGGRLWLSPRRSTPRSPSPGSSAPPTGRSSGWSGAGQGFAPSLRTGGQSMASRLNHPASSGARGRGALAFRPLRPPPGWRRRSCWDMCLIAQLPASTRLFTARTGLEMPPLQARQLT
jgi:D-arginine dehydrogenase